MAWSYDTSLTTNKDRVRLYVGDVLEKIPLLSNEEIEAELVLHNSNLFQTVESLCRALSARFGREAVVEVKDVLRDEKQRQAAHFLELADKFQERSASSDAQIVWTGNYDTSVDSPMFERGLHQ